MTDVRDEAAPAAPQETRGNAAGDFIWYELMTPDPAASKQFYDAVVGWNIDEHSAMPGGDTEYRMINRSDGGTAGGVLTLSPEMQSHGARPTWLGYVNVEDVDRTVAEVERRGGRALMPASDIPNVGRIAMIADPQGAPIYVMKPIPPANDPNATSDVFSPREIGHCAWNELVTSDLEAAKKFYTELFGWTLGGTMPMGEMGDYQFIEQNGTMIGAMFAPQGRPPAWRFCFRVENLEKSIEAVKSGGGEILFGPTEVPGGGRIIQANDPQGAFFMVIEGGQQ